MTEKTIYVCDICGETFDDEESCLFHEESEKRKQFENRVAFFNADGACVDNIEAAFIIWVADEEAFEYVNELLSEYMYAGIPQDFGGGAFPNVFYVDDNADWRCLSTDVNKLLNLERKVKKVVDKLPKM